MKLAVVVRGAITIALALVFFFVFRGPANLVNAFLIPMLIYLSGWHMSNRELGWMMGVFVATIFLLYTVQIFLALLYCLLAAVLRIVQKKKMPHWKGVLILTVFTGPGIGVGIHLTDAVFLTRMYTLFMMGLQGNQILYFIILVIMGAVFSVCLQWAASTLDQRQQITTAKRTPRESGGVSAHWKKKDS